MSSSPVSFNPQTHPYTFHCVPTLKPGAERTRVTWCFFVPPIQTREFNQLPTPVPPKNELLPFLKYKQIWAYLKPPCERGSSVALTRGVSRPFFSAVTSTVGGINQPHPGRRTPSLPLRPSLIPSAHLHLLTLPP